MITPRIQRNMKMRFPTNAIASEDDILPGFSFTARSASSSRTLACTPHGADSTGPALASKIPAWITAALPRPEYGPSIVRCKAGEQYSSRNSRSTSFPPKCSTQSRQINCWLPQESFHQNTSPRSRWSYRQPPSSSSSLYPRSLLEFARDGDCNLASTTLQ